jgi:A/G-specific adenine glycosylase
MKPTGRTSNRSQNVAVPNDEVIAKVRRAMLARYDRDARVLPWRGSRDPYAIWVSEVMLQQTRVDTVIPYYKRFMDRFPSPRKLADAPIDSVLSAWAGLGYYRRARMLHAGAKQLVEHHHGKLPMRASELRTLPGIGEYTAGAIASMAFGQREPVVDGNVERVLTRVFALSGDPRMAANKKFLWSLARRFADCERPGDTNQALMELGATVCLPSLPRCLDCPVKSWCKAREKGEPERYPEKRSARSPREEYWAALVAFDSDRKRVWLGPSELGRWNGMLVPPLRAIDSSKRTAVKNPWRSWGAEKITVEGEVTHVLTHAAMHITVYSGVAIKPAAMGSMVPIQRLPELAVPKVTQVILHRASASALKK